MLKMTSKITAVFAWTACALVPQVQAQPAAPEAFQGLPWGATVAEIQKRFPSAVSRDLRGCDPNDAKTRTSGKSCRVLTVPRYLINDLDFSATFYLAERDETLVSVALTAIVRMDPSTPHLRPELMAKCAGLRDLLSQRYGAGEWLSATSTPAQFQQTTRWPTTATIVRLDCATSYSSSNEIDLWVNYAPAVTPAARKL
jgi:hypothetical protein